MADYTEFIDKVNSRNRLRQEINTKKMFYAKLLQHPECLSETLVLKSEIESLELELASLR